MYHNLSNSDLDDKSFSGLFADRRKVSGYAIDAQGTALHDDALNVIDTDQDYPLLEVHIAEPVNSVENIRVAHPNQISSVNDLRLINNLLQPHQTIGSCSLSGTHRRPSLSLQFQQNDDSEYYLRTIETTVCRSNVLTHEQAGSEILNGSSKLHKIFKLALEIRRSRLFHKAFTVDSSIEDLDIEGEYKERSLAALGSTVVEEFCTMANHLFSQYAIKHDIPVLYRNHVLSEEDSERLFVNFERNKHDFNANSFAGLGTSYGEWSYSAKYLENFTSGLGSYAPFASPLRSVPDYINHVNVLAYLQNQNPPYDTAVLDRIARRLNRFAKNKDSHRQKKSSVTILRSLSNEYLEKRLKEALLKNNISQPLLQEVKKRLTEKRLSPSSLARMLMAAKIHPDSHWKECAGIIQVQLASNLVLKSKAETLLDQYQQNPEAVICTGKQNVSRIESSLITTDPEERSVSKPQVLDLISGRQKKKTQPEKQESLDLISESKDTSGRAAHSKAAQMIPKLSDEAIEERVRNAIKANQIIDPLVREACNRLAKKKLSVTLQARILYIAKLSPAEHWEALKRVVEMKLVEDLKLKREVQTVLNGYEKSSASAPSIGKK